MLASHQSSHSQEPPQTAPLLPTMNTSKRSGFDASNISGPMSVIGSDLAILGGELRIISQGNLTVDGVVEGDVMGANVIIGEHAEVKGLIHGGTVVVHGRVTGTIQGVNVLLQPSARVDADIHHHRLKLVLGAEFEGSSRSYDEHTNLLPNLEQAAKDRQNPVQETQTI
ncbi:conserved protein of unknown function [Candidatus Filomicrobium marinum]|uniref:Cell shape determination protein CcmA n=3 Tax=Hyphomicrobiaceae TaxID=45401 RepID=A0A0D6JDN5_9HYPH|nr:conserved protein of unknown function [Candidatus Filomicrobium marinum]CPR17479.1 conserved protein of unknown function [Candidatus Filomicrobium marinum]